MGIAIIALAFTHDAAGFTSPVEAPPGTETETLFTAKQFGNEWRLGVGTYNLVDKLNIGRGSIFQGDPINPIELGSIDVAATISGINGIFVKDNYVFIANAGPGNEALKIIDVTNPARPKELAVDFSQSPEGLPDFSGGAIRVIGDLAYMTFNIGNGPKGDAFRIIDVSDPIHPIVLGGSNLATDINMPGRNPVGLFVSGNYVYLTFALGATNAEKFRIIDVSDPQNPKALSGGDAVTPAAQPRNLHVVGPYAYIAGNAAANGLAVVSINDPLSPQLKTEITTGTNVKKVYVLGRYVYAAQGAGGGSAFRVIDIVNPTAPVVISGSGLTLPADAASDIVVIGRYAFLSFTGNSNNALRVIDIQNPNSPKVVGGDNFIWTGATSGEKQMFISGSRLYIAGGTDIFIFDITGIKAVGGRAHALEAGNTKVQADFQGLNNLNTRTGVNIGQSAKFEGNLSASEIIIEGALTVAGSKTFEIDDPRNPKEALLRHVGVESSERTTLYDGIASLDKRGEAIVHLPDYFESLNNNYRYQLSSADGSAMPNIFIKKEIENNQFTIGGGVPFGEVGWQVTGIRQDEYAKAHPFIAEFEKETPGYLNKEAQQTNN